MSGHIKDIENWERAREEKQSQKNRVYHPKANNQKYTSKPLYNRMRKK